VDHGNTATTRCTDYFLRGPSAQDLSVALHPGLPWQSFHSGSLCSEGIPVGNLSAAKVGVSGGPIQVPGSP
jgi:hypothetical protein